MFCLVLRSSDLFVGHIGYEIVFLFNLRELLPPRYDRVKVCFNLRRLSISYPGLRPLKAEMKTTSRQKSGEVRSESRSRNESRSRQESRLEDIETEKDDTSSSIFTGKVGC